METKLIAAEIATAAGVATIITSSKNPTNVFSIIEYNSNIQKQLLPDSINASTLSPSQSSSASASGVTTPSSALTSISMSSEDTVTSFSAPQGLSIPVPPSSSSSSQISEATTPLALVRPPHTLFQPSPKPLRDAKSWTAYTLAPAGTVIIDAGAHRVLAKRDSGGRLLAVGVLSVVGTFAPGQAVRIVVRKRTEKAEKAADAAVAHIHKEIKGLKTRARQSTSDSGTGSPATPATPSLLPMSLSTISVSSLEPFSRSGSDASMTDLNAVGGQDRHLDSTPLAGKIALPSENNNDQEDAKKDRDPTAVIPVPLTEDDKKPKETTIQYSAAVEEGWIEVEVGRGLANYNSVEISKIKGMKR
jgi:glutamate 5-kinase